MAMKYKKKYSLCGEGEKFIYLNIWDVRRKSTSNNISLIIHYIESEIERKGHITRW